jgi:hypothetical protein
MPSDSAAAFAAAAPSGSTWLRVKSQRPPEFCRVERRRGRKVEQPPLSVGYFGAPPLTTAQSY